MPEENDAPRLSREDVLKAAEHIREQLAVLEELQLLEEEQHLITLEYEKRKRKMLASLERYKAAQPSKKKSI